MILLYMTLGVIVVMLLFLTFIPKKYLLEDGWSESQIDAVKGVFHTNKKKEH